MQPFLRLVALLCLSTLAPSSARAADAPPPPGRAERTVTVVTAAGVSASVTFQGDYGPTRIEGYLINLPDEPIRAREGKQVKEIGLRYLQELQRTPLGVGPDALSTYQLSLFSGESYILQPDKTEPPPGAQPAAITRTLQVVSIPQGSVELKTAPFGVVPTVPIPLQVFENLTLTLPFNRITNFRRDPMGGTTTVSFGIAEGVTGRVKTMPTDPLVLRTPDGEERRIPLSEVIQYSLDEPIGPVANQATTGGASKG